MLRIPYFILLFLICFKLTADDPWEEKLHAYFVKAEQPYYNRVRFYTYLYVAINCASEYPCEVHERIAYVLIKKFFPNYKDLTEKAIDPEIACLADTILCPYLERIALEDASAATFTSSRWPRKISKATKLIAKWIPWTCPLPEPPPPLAADNHDGWKKQWAQLKTIRQNLTQEQRDLLKIWRGARGRGMEWRLMALRYMQEKNIPYEHQLLVRATLMMAMYDGLIAEMKWKFTYCIQRPFMMDSNFKPIGHELSNPSYPSGQGIIGSIFATVLCYFFPEDQAHWESIRDEGALTRLWAGVHFPEDVKQGGILGKKIALQVIEFAENKQRPR